MNRHENPLPILVTRFIYHPVFSSLSGVLAASEYYLELAKEYLSSNEIAQKWNISSRRVRILCGEGRVEGAIQKDTPYFFLQAL